MRAQTYRHVESQSTIGGLSLNGFVALLGLAFAAIQWLSFVASVAVIAGTYLALRLMGRGRPPMYWQHLAVWHVRRVRARGRVSAAVRATSPQFPFGPYEFRDRRRR
jgi:hypothetical protein